jgi:protease-4
VGRRRTVAVVIILIGILLTGLLGFAGIAYVALFHEPKPTIQDGSVLVLDLRREIEEVTERPLLLSLREGRRASLMESVRLLRAAADDARIARVLVRTGALDGIGWAAASELREALRSVRESGKPVEAYLDFATDLGYYVASAANRIAMPSTGVLLLDGLYGNVFFFKNLLAKADISFEDVHAGAYKSTPEIFTRDSMSEPFREQIEALVDNEFDVLLRAVADGRSLSLAEARSAIDSGPYLVPEAALEAGLVDTICSGEEFEATLGVAEEDSSLLVDMNAYRASEVLSTGTSHRTIGVVFAVGDILPGSDESGPMGRRIAASEAVAGAIEEAAEDDAIEAIVLRVSSPGGSATASDEILDAVVRARAKKPVVVSMGDVAASGGYWISSGANLVLADATTITGSIGVFALRPVLHRFYERIGLDWDEVQRGRNADIFATSEPWSPEQRSILERGIDHIYDLFIGKVAEGRGLTVEEVEGVAGGRVWSGSDAASVRLVDRLGGIVEGIDAAKELAGIPGDEKVRIRAFPKERSIFEKIREGDFGIRAAAMGEARSLLARYDIDLPDILPYGNGDGVFWAYLPFVIRE